MRREGDRGVEWFLGLLGICLVGLRFIHLGVVPFVVDEPATLIRVDEFFATGEFRWTLARGSQIHFPYGAGALWFYMVPKLLSWHPMVSVWFHTLFYCLGFWFLYEGVRLTWGRLPALVAFVFAASSPFLFFGSRHPWDNTLFIPISGAAFWLLARLDQERSHWGRRPAYLLAGLAGVLAWGVNIHLMSLPLVAASGLAVLLHLLRCSWPWRARLQAGALCAGLLAALVTPYFVAAVDRFVNEPFESNVRRNAPWGDGRNLWWITLRSTLYGSVYAAKNYLDPHVPQFLDASGPVAFFFRKDLFGWIPKLAAYGFALAPLVNWRREVPLAGAFAAALLLCFLLNMHYANIPTDPHHYVVVWWIVFAGAAAMLFRVSGAWRGALGLFLAATVVINTLFNISFLRWVGEKRGTRGFSLYLGASDQVRVVEEICNGLRTRGVLGGDVDIRETQGLMHGMRYLFRNHPACVGLDLRPADHPAVSAPVRVLPDEADSHSARVKILFTQP